MADIWLMRHATYIGHRPRYHAPPDAALTAEGHQEARNSLPLPHGITGIVTSPLLRARQTAAVLSENTGLPVLAVSDLLAEWRAPTSVIGRPADTYPSGYAAWRERRLSEPTLVFEDGESLQDLFSRACDCALFLRGYTCESGSVLAVSHKILLGVLTRLHDGPRAFHLAVTEPWAFAEVRGVGGG